jgi:hypothetical protein
MIKMSLSVFMTEPQTPETEIDSTQVMEVLNGVIESLVAPAGNPGSLSYPNVVAVVFDPVEVTEGEVVSAASSTVLPEGFERGKIYIHNGNTCTWFKY